MSVFYLTQALLFCILWSLWFYPRDVRLSLWCLAFLRLTPFTDHIYFFKLGPFPASFSHKFFTNFLTEYNLILYSSVVLSCCHIHTVDDFLNCGTLLSPEPEWLTLHREHKRRESIVVDTSVYGFSTKANSGG